LSNFKPNCPSVQHDKFEVDRRLLLLGKKLGSGQFGDVYRGVWKNSIPVAVKTMKEADNPDDVKDFLYEAEVMKPLDNKFLISLLCVCTLELPFLIVTEFMPKGALNDFLKSKGVKEALSPAVLCYLITDVAAGMEYLENQSILHRDLAARNILVGAQLEMKVADFGLAKKIDKEFKAEPGAKFPIRWTAIESLRTNTFTVKSDVWSFGIVLWELCSYGTQPYQGMSINRVLTEVEGGHRLSMPENTPEKIYELMLQCWEKDPAARPSFHKILQIMKSYQTNALKKELDSSREILAIKSAKKEKKEKLSQSQGDLTTPKKDRDVRRTGSESALDDDRPLPAPADKTLPKV